jgi:peptidyl-prolyl cis-trans isomerase A (cyclophilin A)
MTRARSLGYLLCLLLFVASSPTVTLADEKAAAAPAAEASEGSKEPGVKGPDAKGGASEKGAAQAGVDDALMRPRDAKEQAPAEFKVRFETTKGPFVVAVHRAWAPNGADRFYNLVKLGFYDDAAFFRVIQGFMAQFGMHSDPRVTGRWRNARIKDDPVVESNTRGRITFAKTGAPHSRTTQLFINFGDNASLDSQGFAPFGEVVEGMDVVDSIFVIGEGAPRGRGPSQQMIQRRGNAYLRQQFPDLDYIVRARIAD